MTEDKKRKFSSWESMRDHAWREFIDKSNAEWRLSFGIWTALLGSAGALIASESSVVKNINQHVSPCIIVLGVIFIIVAHVAFLIWIQTKLQQARNYLSEAQDEMRKLLGKSKSPPKQRRIWCQWSLYVQFCVTVLLVSILIAVIKFSGG